MLPCEKRQTIVTRETGEVEHRCLNRDCEAFSHSVDENVCSVCPLRVSLHKPPCKEKPEECEECKPIEDEVLLAALERVGGFEDEIKPEDTPDGTVPDYPSMSVQIWLYKEALVRWHKAGRPVRSDEEVLEILETKCKGCEWYDAEKEKCKGCGCRITEGGFPATNKIKMATEHCPHPDRKW